MESGIDKAGLARNIAAKQGVTDGVSETSKQIEMFGVCSFG